MKWVSWRVRALSVLAMASVLALQACGGGGGGSSAPNPATPAGEVTTPAAQQATQGSTSASLGVAAGGNVSLPLSTARVTLPAASLVDTTGAAASGSVTVKLTAIDPALAPKSVAGGLYTTDTTAQAPLLETFGAIDVQATDAVGQALKLAPGKLATLRIPVRTRATTAPASIDLYFFDTAQQIWVKESSATLAGDVTTGQYYEGKVGHAGTWGAAVAITDTVNITGCVEDDNHKVPTGTVKVYTDGVDYSALAWSTLGSDGKFSVRMKRGASALLVVKDAASEATAVNTLSTVVADKDQGACLRLLTAIDPAPFLSLMTSLTEVVTLALAPSATVSLNTVPQLAPAASVCAKGAVGQYTLDGAAAAAGLPIGASSTHQLNVGFKACAPQVAGLAALTGLNAKPAFTGETAAQFSYTLPQSGGFQLTATTQLGNLLNLSTYLSANGQFGTSVSSDATGTKVLAVVTPTAGATLTHLISGRTLSFIGGSVQVSSSGVNTTGLSYNDFSFKLNGNTYVVSGTFNSNNPTVASTLTMRRNGETVGIISLNPPSADGIVDPF
jgi:hypothetical protein